MATRAVIRDEELTDILVVATNWPALSAPCERLQHSNGQFRLSPFSLSLPAASLWTVFTPMCQVSAHLIVLTASAQLSLSLVSSQSLTDQLLS